VACLSSELGRRPLARTVLGTPVVLFRTERGAASALVDRCPHRNVALSLGRVRDGLLECCYHGWRFDGFGTCRAVPGLVGEEPDRRSRRAASLPAWELDGLVWVWPDPEQPAGGEPFRLPYVADPGYTTVRHAATLTASLHAALENTLDVPHTAFLHRGLFRGGREPVEIEVVVRQGDRWVEAEYVGEPRPEGVAGRVLAPEGGVVGHVDRFVLPSIAQVEYRLGDNHLVTTTAFTPVDQASLRLHAAVTFHLRVPHAAVRPLVTPVARLILAQDAKVLRAQSENVERFGGEQFSSTELDVLGQHILRLLKRAERGEEGPAGEDRRVRIRV
jgi:phenylpropionate dioxygenase-like ring-hydroxylating dioxygenase large terminal subunit